MANDGAGRCRGYENVIRYPKGFSGPAVPARPPWCRIGMEGGRAVVCQFPAAGWKAGRRGPGPRPRRPGPDFWRHVTNLPLEVGGVGLVDALLSLDTGEVAPRLVPGPWGPIGIDDMLPHAFSPLRCISPR